MESSYEEIKLHKVTKVYVDSHLHLMEDQKRGVLILTDIGLGR